MVFEINDTWMMYMNASPMPIRNNFEISSGAQKLVPSAIQI